MHYTRFDGPDPILSLNSAGARFHMDMHVHDEFVIAGYFGGTKAFIAGGRDGRASAGDFLVIAPGVPHAARSHGDEGCTYLAIYPTLEQMAALTGLQTTEVEQRLAGSCLFHAGDGGTALGSALADIFADTGDLAGPGLAALASELLDRADGAAPARVAVPGSLQTVWERIHDDPAARLDLEELSRLAGLSREHLCRSFRAAFGISPFQLLRARRTALARALVSQGTSLAEAAAMAGFADQSHMTRWFQRIYGVTPGAIGRYQ